MNKKKFLGVLSILLLIGITSTALSASATNPEHLDLDYDFGTNDLSIYFIHGVTYTDKHYVNNIEVYLTHLNVTTLEASESFTSQETYNIVHLMYNFVAVEGENSSTGDDILVIITCNLGGIFQKYLHLYPTPAGHEFEFSSVVPAFIAGAFIASIFALLPMLIKENRAKQKHKFKLPKFKRKHKDNESI